MRQTGGVLDVRLEAIDVDAMLAAQHPTSGLGLHVRLTFCPGYGAGYAS